LIFEVVLGGGVVYLFIEILAIFGAVNFEIVGVFTVFEIIIILWKVALY